jgi:cytoskeletal protein RodZ
MPLSLRLFHISCCSLLLAFLLSLLLPPWARTTSASVSQLLHRRSLVTRSTQRRSSPLSLRGLRLPSPCVSRLTTQTTPRGLQRRSGRTSRPSSAPGSRARMSRSTPRMRRTRTAAARTRTTTTTTTTTTKAVAAVTVTAAAGAAAAAARTVTAAAAGAAVAVAAAAEAAPGAAAAAAATGPVARCHWSFRY